MAALPVESTARLFVDYSGNGENHTLLIRFGVGSSASEAMDVADALFTAVGPSLAITNITGARVADKGSTVTYPVTWTGASSYGTGPDRHEQAAMYWDFIGRTIGGKRGRCAIFGVVAAFDGSEHDYRWDASDNAQVAAALVALRANPACPVGIDGDVLNWHDYANAGVNAYWRNHIR